MALFTDSLNQRSYPLLWLLSILGALAITPYLFYLGVMPADQPLWQSVLLQTLQKAIFFGIILWLCSLIIAKTDLKPFSLSGIRLGFVIGILLGGLILLLDWGLFGGAAIDKQAPPWWAGALGSLYGSINEEIALRLFLLSLLYWPLSKLFPSYRPLNLWVATSIAALLFGMAHLPALFEIMTPDATSITRVLFLNGIAGLALGWLYWSQSIWAAMVAHFMADLVLHAL